MKIFKYICAALMPVLTVAIVSCSDGEDELEPTGISSAYHLPQGNHGYDTRIVDFFNKTGTYILYDFTQKEACWTPTGWKLGKVSDDDSGELGYIPQKADQAYVGKALDLINSICLDYYSDKFKKELLPVKLLLCSQLDSVYADYEYIFTPTFQMKTSYKSKPIPAWYNYHNICINYVSAGMDTLSRQDKQYMKFYLNDILMNSMMLEGKVGPTKAFQTGVDYEAMKSVYDVIKRFDAGTFPDLPGLSIDGDNSVSANRDWYIFMYMMIAYPESFLTDSNVTLDTYYSSADSMLHGILSSVKDTKGLIRERYNTVREFFKTNYDTDLQTVGNSQP